MGVTFETAPADVDEVPQPGESAEALAERLACEKAAKIAAAAACPVLAADTVVALDSRILGKPRDSADAARMLELLSGIEHRVVTAVALLRGTTTELATVATRIWFRPLNEVDIRRYAISAEARDAAGGYAVQSGAAPFVARLVGSYSNVVGLPLAETAALLSRAEILA